MAFVETLHIFIGKDNHFFTLRQSYQHQIVGGQNANGQYNIRYETRYAHMFNLSQDYKEARAKAVEYSERLGYPLIAAATSEAQLLEINRRTAADIEAAKQEQDRAVVAKAAAEYARREEYFNIWKAEALESLNSGNFPYNSGQYSGHLLEFVPVTYFQWVVSMKEVETPFNKFAWIASIIDQYVDIPTIKESEYVGEVKGKVELEIQVQRVLTFDGMYGRTYLYSMIDRDGNDLAWFSSTPILAEVNGWVKIKATIKSQEIYHNRKQTMLTRGKVV